MKSGFRKKIRKGFTLVEVIIVLVIIAIIAAIAVPNISNYIDNSKKRSCESMMSSFVNDLEYKVVSKRFYDINDLNTELAGVVRSYGEIDSWSENGTEIKCGDGQVPPPGSEMQVSDVCPNGGKYTLKWTITATEDENRLVSAKVNFGVVRSDIKVCECDCMKENNRVSVETHEFTAALISTHYDPVQHSDDDDAFGFLDVLVNNIESSGAHGPEDVKNLVSDNSNEHYTVAGLVMNGSSVEWLCIYPDPREMDTVKFYTYRKNSNSLSAEAVKGIWTLESGDFTDLSKWPAAEGSAGSLVYKEGWNEANVIASPGNDVNAVRPADADGNAVDSAETDKLVWIQRDGQWYVQKNDLIPGIDVSFSSETDALTPQKHPLVSDAGKELTGITVSAVSDSVDLKHAFKVNAGYADGSTVKFSHMTVKQDGENPDTSYGLENGYIFVSSEDDVNSKTWSGIFSENSSDMTELEKLLKAEDKLIDDFLTGKNKTITIAYQEYFKSLNPENGLYNVPEPVTKFVNIVADGSYRPDSSREYEVVTDEDKVDVVIPVLLPVKVEGSQSDEPLLIPVTVTKPLFGSSSSDPSVIPDEITVDGKPVVTVKADESSTSYSVTYSQSSASDNKFSTKDITVTRDVTYNIYSTAGEDEKKIGSSKAAETVKHTDGTYSGFFVGTENGSSDISYNEKAALEKINSGSASASDKIHLYYYDKAQGTKTVIADITTGAGKASWEYPAELKTFTEENLKNDFKVKITYPVDITGSANTSVNASGSVVYELKHADSSSGDGFWLSASKNGTLSDDSALINQINDLSKTAYVTVKKSGDTSFTNKSVCRIDNTYESLTANYTNDGTNFTAAAYSRLEVYGTYKIAFTSENGAEGNTAEIFHEVILNHDEPNTNIHRYFTCVNGNLNKFEDTKFILTWEKGIKSSDKDFLTTNVANTWTQIQNATKFTAYVYFKDGDDLKIAPFSHDSTSSINPPDFVYFKTESALAAQSDDTPDEAHLVAYLGSDVNVKIPSSYTGYWTDSQPSGIGYAEKDGYYYVPDGRTYNITRIGKYSSENLPVNATQATVSFRPGYSFKSLTISEGIKEIGPYAFYNAPVSTNGSVKIADSVETIGAYAFANAGNGNLSMIELGTVNQSSVTSSSTLKTIGASAFRDCSGLTDTAYFIIPSSVMSVGINAFDNFRMPGGTFVINGVSELGDDEKSSGSAAQESSVTTVSALTVDGVKKTGIVSGLPFGDGSDENKKFTVNKLVVGGNTEVIGSGAFKAVNFEGEDSSVEITGYVSTVGDSAFKGTNFRKSLIFGSNVEIIENSAFEDCDQFTGSLNLNKITEIRSDAFAGMTAVTGNLTVPGTVTRLDQGAFDGFASGNSNSETYPSLVINGCTNGSLGAGIFTNGHFKNVTISGNVRDISARAFKNSPLNGKVPYNEFKGTLTIGSSVDKIGLAAFEGCTGFTGNLVLPQNTGLTKIDDAAFNGCIGFSGTLTIPSNITEIGSRAFMNCVGFDGELILSSNLNKIGMEAFKNCTKFKKGLTVPSGITGGIGSCAFQKFASAVNDTDRGTLKLYSGSTAGGREIGAFIFTEAKFDGVIVGGTVEKIGASAFHHSNEDKLYLTSDSYIDDESRDKVETKENRDTLTADYSGITGTLVIESSVTDIDDMAFYACSGLTGTPMFNAHKNGNGEYVSSETAGVTHFGESAFEGCTGFSGELFVPKTTDSIERYAFKSYGNGSCSLRVYGGSDGTVLGSLREGEDYHPIFPSSSFTNVTIGGNVTEISPLFMDNDLIDSIEKKKGSVLSDADKSNYRYSGIRGTLTIESSVTRIGEAAFKKTQFTQIKGGVSADTPALSSVTYVGREAFDNCTQLSGMVSLSNAKTIENAAFRNCSSLRGDDQPGDLQLLNIETVGVSSFEGCTGFTGKLFLNGQNGTGLTSIGSDAFKSCTGLTGGVTIPESVTHIGTGAFEKFSSAGTQGSLKINGVSGKVNAEDEYGYISPGIFTDSYFKDVTIGGNVQTIKADAFRGCTGFTGTLTIGGVVETIEKQAFDTCEYLTGISLDNDGHLSSIGEGAFARCRRVEDGLYIPSSVNHIDRCAFKYFAENTPDAKLGTLKIYGTSDANGNLGNTVPDSDGGPLFSSARFNGVIIGGNVRTIAHNQFDNKRYYKFGTDLKYGDGSPVAYTEQFGGQNDNYDFSGISGDLTIEQGVTTIGGNAFACMNFDNVTIPRSVTDIGETAFMFAGSGNGKLKVLGTSASGQTLGNGEEHPIFLGAKFNGVVIGGNVKKIEKSFMHNKAGITDKELKQSNNEKNEEGADIRVAYRFNYTYNDIRGPLTIGNSVEEIGENAFESDHFDGRLILGEKLDESSPSDVRLYKIGMYAFKNCTKFNGDLIIPHSMKTIEEDAFYSFASAAPQAHTLVIWGGTSDNGNTLGNLKTAGSNEVPVDIFAGAHFKDVAIGGNVHKIEKMAFKNDKTDARRTYDNIKGSLTLGPGVIEIRSEAFLKCKFDGKLGISDPDMVLHGDVSQSEYPDVTIGESAFKDLHDLYTNYTVKDRNGNIIRDSSGNPVQPEFIIPATVKSIGANAFTSLGLNIANKSDYPALKLYGCSLVNGDERVFGVSGRWDRKADIIPYANFRNVTIGGNITTIAENAFDNSSEKYIRFTGNLTIEKTVDNIWKEAFNECTGFDGTLTIESLYDKNDTSRNDGLEKIGIKAFYGCTNFTGGLHIPYTVERIGSKAFSYFASDVPDDKDGLLNIEGYSDEKDVNFTVFNYNRTKARTIEADIFNHSKFENVSVGWNTEVIEAGFMKSYTKTETDKETGAETTEVFDYSGVTGSLYIGDNVVYIGNEAFSAEFGTPGFNGSLSFGDGNNYKKVIGQKAFARQQFTGDLKIPYTIGRIEESAFWCCDKFTGELVFNTYTLDKLQLIIPGATALPSNYGTDTIGVAAFSGCTGFYSNTTGKTLTIPSTVETLGENAFYKFGDDNNQDSVNYPGLEVLGGTKTNGTVILNKQIFPYSKFYDVTIGGKVSSIADDFMNNTIKNTYYGKTSAGNAEKVMYDNIKGKVTVKGTVNTIGNNAFKSLPLRGGLELENGVTTIGASAFEGCIYASGDITGERRLTIPSSVTSIGNYAFKNFGSMIYEQHLNKLFIYGTTHANGVLDSSQTDIFAGARFTDVTIGGNVRSVSEYCFSDYSKYGYFGGTLTIEKNSVTSLAQSDTNGQHGSFFGCNFNKVYLPESLYNTYDTKRWHVFGGNWNNAGFYNKLN